MMKINERNNKALIAQLLWNRQNVVFLKYASAYLQQTQNLHIKAQFELISHYDNCAICSLYPKFSIISTVGI